MQPHRNALAAPLLLPCILLAAQPALEWRADLADTGAATLYARHGDAVGLSCRLSLRGEPYAPESALCHYQTNGMGAAWWEAPVSLASNVATVAWSPALDPGADLVLLVLELDGAHRAALHLHLRPGPAPGSSLPPPTAVLDFAAIQYTNAPWALPADIPPAPDLSPYATTSYVASAVASIDIPEPDLSAYATSSYVAEAVAAMHPDFEEWAAPTVDRISASAVAAGIVAEPRGDAVATVGRTSGYALRALRSYRSGDMVSETDIEGEWALVAETDSAILTSNVLQNTTRSGLATVEFTPADGSDALRISVSMPGDTKRTTATWPAREVSGNWRKSAVYPPYEFDGTVLRVNTNAWYGKTYICTNYSEATPWIGVTAPNPAFVGSPPLWYAARRRANGSDMGGGLVGIAPHYALCAAHCGHTYSSTWITNYAAGLAVTTARGSKVDQWGDLRLVRLPDPGVPAQCRAKLLRASVLKEKSSSMLFRDLGVAWTQHGFFAACLLEPRNGGQTDLSGYSWDRGWTYVGARDEWRNTTWGVDEMANTLSHDAHAGDSGHPCFFTINGHCIPVGVFHWANGSGECLLSDAMLEKIDDAVRRDSGGTETLDYLTAEDLEQQQP